MTAVVPIQRAFASHSCVGITPQKSLTYLQVTTVEDITYAAGRNPLVDRRQLPLPCGKRHSARQFTRRRSVLRMESSSDSAAPSSSVSVLGTGILGKAIALRLHKLGFSVQVWTRSPERQQEAADAGLKVAASAEAAVGSSDVVLLLLADHPAIQAVLFPPEGRMPLRGKTVVQMATISAGQSRTLGAACDKEGAHYLECPVQGSQGEAFEGCLQLMVGGEAMPETDSTVGGVLAALGEQRIYVGPVGAAAALKLSLNNLLAMEQAAFSSSLGVVLANEVPVETFMSVLRGSAMYAKQFEKKLPKMLAHDYANANFHTRHLLKDVALFEMEAAAAGLVTTPQQGLLEAVKVTMERGFGEADYSSLYEGVGVASK